MSTKVFKQLSDTEHVLHRSARYIGSITSTKASRFYLVDGVIKYGEIEYVPALLKLIREIVDNSIDNAIDNNFKYGNKISITISKDKIIVQDNGTGIPVKLAKDSKGNNLPELIPTLAWCSLRAGSNFEDKEDNTTMGQNGEGAVLANIFSTLFIGETCDGTTKYKLVCKDNLSSKEVSTTKGKKRFTRVTFKPDLKRMNLDEISPLYMDLLEFDLLFLQKTYPKINFIFKRV